jgi:NADPH:quinone reductase-like Zn-dependent oxidoreductase
MRAIVQDRCGENAADVRRPEELDRPKVGEDGVVVRVHAASLHIDDWHVVTLPIPQGIRMQDQPQATLPGQLGRHGFALKSRAVRVVFLAQMVVRIGDAAPHWQS